MPSGGRSGRRHGSGCLGAGAVSAELFLVGGGRGGTDSSASSDAARSAIIPPYPREAARGAPQRPRAARAPRMIDHAAPLPRICAR